MLLRTHSAVVSCSNRMSCLQWCVLGLGPWSLRTTKDTFWSPWPWPCNPGPWPWPWPWDPGPWPWPWPWDPSPWPWPWPCDFKSLKISRTKDFYQGHFIFVKNLTYLTIYFPKIVFAKSHFRNFMKSIIANGFQNSVVCLAITTAFIWKCIISCLIMHPHMAKMTDSLLETLVFLKCNNSWLQFFRFFAYVFLKHYILKFIVELSIVSVSSTKIIFLVWGLK